MRTDKLDTFFITGAIYGGPAIAAINFSPALRGGNPPWYGTAVSLLLALFWIAWLVRYRNQRGYLMTSLWLTAGLLTTVLLAVVWQLATLPLVLEVTMYLGVALFFIPYYGLTGYLKDVAVLYPLLLAVGIVWLGVHFGFLYRLRGKKGAKHEA